MEITGKLVPISNALHVHLVLCQAPYEGHVAFIVDSQFTAFSDQNDRISGLFDSTGFSLKEDKAKEYEVYSYNQPYPYKIMPVLKAWLIQQGLLWPD